MTQSKRGRPSFKPTALHRRRVEQYVCAGMSHDGIAKALGISDETLRKHFAAELETGSQRRRAEVIDMLFAAARKGNVTAQKKLEEMSLRSVGEAEFMADKKPEEAAATKPAKRGKKEEAQAQAQAVLQDDDWGADIAASLGGRTLN